MGPSSLISAQHVSKRFGNTKVLDDISLQITQPQIFGLLGPSGAGKTTLVKMIAGIEESTEGTIKLFGQKMPDLSMMANIGYMAQADALYADLTAKDNLLFFAALYGLGKTARTQRLNEVTETVGIADDMHKSPRHYSGGMKRRLSLAIALIARPKLLILDEPTVGIDPVLRNQVWDHLHALKENGTGILVTTHVMDEAERCGRLGMIRDSRLIAAGTPEGLKAETGQSSIEQVFLSYGGGSHAR